jgi:hypothetical protein
MDLLARLRSQADSWVRDGAIPIDALQGRDAEAEAALLREAADGLETLADWAGDDTIGFVIVSWIGNRVFEGDLQDKFIEEFHAFYDPKKWLGSHRAAAAFIAQKWLEERVSPPRDEKEKG